MMLEAMSALTAAAASSSRRARGTAERKLIATES